LGDYKQKLFQYFKSEPDYWHLRKELNSDYKISYYPISFKSRIAQNHYKDFDKQGLPLFKSRSGEMVHFITGLCSYAFANWEIMLDKKEDSRSKLIVKIADYLIIQAENINGVLMVKDYDSDSHQRDGLSCAMNQGEVISVLCRAYCVTNNNKYLDNALQMTLAYENEYGEDGISEYIDQSRLVWFKEGGKFILNGHIYSTIGLIELQQINGNERLEKLINLSIDSVEFMIPKFDLGYWSKYWLDSPDYIASAMYHNLHFCQLEYLGEKFKSNVLLDYSKKFKKYSRSPIHRISAGIEMARSKIRLKIESGKA